LGPLPLAADRRKLTQAFDCQYVSINSQEHIFQEELSELFMRASTLFQKGWLEDPQGI
jgi:hypothetical protein